MKIRLSPIKNPAHHAGFSLLEIMLVLLIVGFIVGIASLSITSRSGLDRRIALKEFGNHLNMVLSEAALSGKTWGVRIERTNEDDEEKFIYHWMALKEKQNNPSWEYAAPFELEERYRLPAESLPALFIDNEPVEIGDEVVTEDKENPLKPHIVLQADGEVTPFTLNLSAVNENTNNDSNEPGIEMKVDSLGRLTLPKAEE